MRTITEIIILLLKITVLTQIIIFGLTHEPVNVFVLYIYIYEGESIINQPNLFSLEIHHFFFDVIAL